jgi:hypothetical protein
MADFSDESTFQVQACNKVQISSFTLPKSHEFLMTTPALVARGIEDLQSTVEKITGIKIFSPSGQFYS